MPPFENNKIEFFKFDPPRSFRFDKVRETPPRFIAEGETWRFIIWHSNSTGTLMMKTHRKDDQGAWVAYNMEPASVPLDKKHGINETVELKRHTKYNAWLEIQMGDYPSNCCWLAVIDYFTHMFGIIPAMNGINLFPHDTVINI